MKDFKIEEFLAERHTALLSLNEEQIQAFYEKWNGKPLICSNKEVFWMAIHKAITADTGLPIEFRKKSKSWLEERGHQSWGDGL